MIAKLIEKLNHERKNAIKNGIYHLIQIKFSYNSNRIEGSSLTYEQTAHIFDKSALITEKNENIKLDDIFETINHFECVNYLLESYKEPLNLEYLKTLHKILKKNCSDAIIGGLKGEWYPCRECHIRPDVLLVYIVKNNTLWLLRLGSHSEL
ncbi:type II toxin-antitoxin system mRNA interferase toxin, RelE/StbE family, partial [Helicobacter pylori]